MKLIPMQYDLVLNVGSSSMKYALYAETKLVIRKNIERLFTRNERKQALQQLHQWLVTQKMQVHTIAHRIVHGFQYRKPVLLTRSILKKLRKYQDLAPLHEAPELEVAELCFSLFSSKQYAVFDTGFFIALPERAKLYALPLRFAKKGIIRYGFHGLSHRYVSKNLKGKIISCHLGSGCSIAAIQDGRPIDSSMGFTPLEGLMMGTRSGTIDPAIIVYLQKHEHYAVERISRLLNYESGLLGISGISNDIRDILKKENTSKKAKLSIDMFLYRIVCTIGSYAAALNGLDGIVFTGGIGERNSQIRKRIIASISYLGVVLDNKKNVQNQKVISSKKSKVKVYVIPTDEEAQILRELYDYL